MSSYDRKEEEVRRMLATGHPAVPPGLAVRAAERGRRVLRGRRAVRAVAWTLLALAVVAFCAWAAIARPWMAPPTDTAPPLWGR